MKKKIPEAILTAAAGMLEPFGIDLKALLQDGQPSKQKKQQFLSVADVEEIYGIRRWTLYRRIREGVISAAKLAEARSGKVLVDRESLEDYLAGKII